MNNDLISREALKKDLKQYFTDGVLDGVSAKLVFNQILHDIDNAPTVLHDNYSMGYQDGVKKVLSERPQVVGNFDRLVMPQGEWIVVGRAAYGYVDIECSRCKYLREDMQADNKPNFCENCGADMRKGGAE